MPKQQTAQTGSAITPRPPELPKAQGAPPIIDEAKQKLVTIYLDNVAYAKGKGLVGSFADKHGLVEEHLSHYLKDGWRIAQVHGFGGNSEGLAVRGWIVVLLERNLVS